MTAATEPNGNTAGPSGSRCARLLNTLLWVAAAVGALHASYYSSATAFLVILYVFALLQLAQAQSWRGAFYGGLGVGMLIGATGLTFFWTIFSAAAIALWFVYAVWIALFVTLARLALHRGALAGWLLVPFLWCGLEYFRSELYYLRFAWLSPGFAFADAPWQLPLNLFGTYGTGFLVAAIACGAVILSRRSLLRGLVMLAAGIAVLRAGTLLLPNSIPARPEYAAVRAAGIQMEFPTENEVLVRLNELVKKEPHLDLIVLSEYTFSQPVPEKILKWCRDHGVYLLVGANESAPRGNFYNTACVVSPAGQIVFRQVKSVPIQFFKDGLPAPEQRLWRSPWGLIGICICYDLSYSRVTDRLVKLGAQALIVPTMDVADWGARQHRLHARIANVRAREYGIPIFRLASSGISQSVDPMGHLRASAPFPGEGAVMIDNLVVGRPGSLPADRWVAPASTAVTIAFVLFATGQLFWRKRMASKPGHACPEPADAVQT